MQDLHPSMKRVFEATQKTPAEIASAIDVLPQNITNWSKRGLSKSAATKISEKFGLPLGWLLSGEESNVTTMPTPAEAQIDPNDFIKMEFWDSSTPLYDGEFEVPYYKDTEFLGGSGFLDESYDDGRRKLRYAYTAASRAGANPKKIVCTTLKGDSMEELILDGSMIAIDTSKTDIKEGKIYAFRHGSMLRVKYLIPRPDGGLIIRSHNKKYDDEIIAGEAMEQENIQIVGWVWNWSSLVTW